MAQISIKIMSFFLLKNFDFIFYLVLLRTIFYKQMKLIIDLAERKEVFMTVMLFIGIVLSVAYRIRNLEKQNIEIKQKQADLDNSLEDLRTKRLANNAEEERQKVEL